MSNTFRSGSTLLPGQSLVSAQNNFTLKMQTNGLLVERDASAKVLWVQPTNPANNSHCTMQSDGHLVIRDPQGLVRWDSETGVEGSSLVLQNSGELDVCAPDGTPASILFQNALSIVRALHAFHAQLAVALMSTEKYFLRHLKVRTLETARAALPPELHHGALAAVDDDGGSRPAIVTHDPPGVRSKRGDNGAGPNVTSLETT